MHHPLHTGGPNDPIKYPKVYRGLRRHGYSKEAAARISNSGPEGWRRGGRNSHRGGKHPMKNLLAGSRTRG